MTMHEHDFEAIAALVSEGGSLDDPASACEECRSEFVTQSRIRSILMDAPAPELSGAELTTLRSGVNAELGAPYNRRLRRLVAVASVAAGFLVLVGVGPMLLDPSGGADTAAVDTINATEAGSGAEETAMTALSDSAAPAAAGREFALEERFSEIRDAGVVTRDELRRLEDEMMAVLEESSLKLGPAEYTERERVVPPCLPETTVLGSIEAELEGRPVVSYLVENAGGQRAIERFDAESCELLDRR